MQSSPGSSGGVGIEETTGKPAPHIASAVVSPEIQTL